ncbi:MAG: NADH-quinone oxidoreductase subunit L [Verrucomicrobia bacterium]|nr:NADH-quinone oxidoreductase subunit L [Verrucomicrobiota bacterium]
MTLECLPWLILFLPLLSAGCITLFTQKNRELSAKLSIGAIVAGFVLTILFIAANGWAPTRKESLVPWLEVGDLLVDFGLRLDPLSLMMLLIVAGVGGAIHIYSWGYMHEDRGISRYFAFLSLFTFSMLGIVLANNFLMLFIFWELVGVSSYLLIGFWFERPAAADASKKAFFTNRLGDFGFLLGILMVWAAAGGLNFSLIEDQLKKNPALFGSMATVVGLLIFCGAMGKSAQFPLHVWLPDAMEGPTPVSALIHAATMVAAGVYMLCRVFFVLNITGSFALDFVAWIGGFTALLAAVIAVQQNDIKRILAYSTLSQLGYMVMAVGLGGPTPAMFHLTTHAFFKALLFLGAGSVIIALHHEQDIWKMGGLRKKMPVTFWTFLVGTLALCGVPPFSGFYSKDAILAQALEQKNYLLFALAVLVAALTTFYMFRLLFVAFLGSSKTEEADHAHESPGVMIWPLRVLVTFSVIGGVIGIEALYGNVFGLEGNEHPHGLLAQLIYPLRHAPLPALCGLAAFGIGLFAALKYYAKAQQDPLPAKLGALSRAMANRFYFDEFYEATVIRIHDFIAAASDWIDRWIVEGFCIGLVRGGTDLTGRALRLVQTGNLQTYAFLFVLGVAVVLWFVLGK